MWVGRLLLYILGELFLDWGEHDFFTGLKWKIILILSHNFRFRLHKVGRLMQHCDKLSHLLLCLSLNLDRLEHKLDHADLVHGRIQLFGRDWDRSRNFGQVLYNFLAIL